MLSHLGQEAKQSRGRLIAVFGAAGDRDRAKRPRFASIATQLSNFFIITTEDPFGESGSTIIEEVAQGATPADQGGRWDIEEDRRSAIARAIHMARKGDVVAVTGKGHEQSIALGEHLMPWSDSSVVLEILQEFDGGND